MKKTYEYRIYPTDEQKSLLAKHFGHCRWMYNYALSRKISHYKQTSNTLSRYDIQAEIPVLKKQETTEWLKEVNSQSLQAVLIHLDAAYNKFFTKSGGFPKFKNSKSKQSFEISKNLTVDFTKSEIELPKFNHFYQVRERITNRVIKEGIFTTDTDDWYFARKWILVEIRDQLPKNIDWAVDSVIID